MAISHSLWHLSSGEEVLATLHEVRPDVVFLDINMPGLTGLECLKGIRSDKEFDKIPVIIYSTSSHPSWIQQAFDLKANRYFIKPSRYPAITQGLGLLFKLTYGELTRNPDWDNFVIHEDGENFPTEISDHH